MSIADYLQKYPTHSSTKLAQLMIFNGHSTLAERTLRRHIAEKRTDTYQDETPQSTQPVYHVAEHNKYYHYQDDVDTYFFFLPGEKPCKLKGETVRSLKSAYSDWDGNPQTINAICRTFTLSRKLFTKLKNALGWSHDAEPFTDEDVLNRSEDDLLQDLLQAKKFQLEQRFQASRLIQQEKDARKWNEFKEGILNPFEQQLTHRLSAVLPKQTGVLPRIPYVAVCSPFDLHYGKYCWIEQTGTQYTRAIARHLLLSHTDELLQDMAPYNIDHFIVPVGSDFFHVDTSKGTTTSGTQQDMDGTPEQIMAEGCALMIEYIDRLARVAPVTINMAPGNHDHLLSHSLLMYLQGYYRNSPQITVKKSHRSQQYEQWGDTMMGFAHGDGTKLATLPLLMMQESNPIGTIKHRLWFTGHYHSIKQTDVTGSLVMQLPSLSGTDRWHEKNGYTGNVRGMCAYLVCAERGLRHQLHSPL